MDDGALPGVEKLGGQSRSDRKQVTTPIETVCPEHFYFGFSSLANGSFIEGTIASCKPPMST